MLYKPIQEWLSEYKTLSDEEVHTFACTVRENKALIDGLYKLFDQKPIVEELDPVCHQLFEFYRSKEPSLQRFALQFLPALISLYLTSLSHNDKKSCGGVEAFLLGMYNLEIVNEDGTAKVNLFRVPSVAQGSIYHEPVTVSALSLTESALNRYNRPGDVWRGGPYPHYENINGQNRQAVLSQLVQVYNADIAELHTHSLLSLCQTASRLTMTGMPSLAVCSADLQSWPTSNGPRPKVFTPSTQRHTPRIPISPALLIEILWGVNFAFYNGCDKVARKAVQDIHARASYELLSDVMLVTQAFLNLEKRGAGLGDGVGPMGITVPIAMATTSVTKGALTNASFKAKKLPEDIVVEVDPSLQTKLSPIVEEEPRHGLVKHVLRLSKGRKKDADNEKTRSRELQAVAEKKETVQSQTHWKEPENQKKESPHAVPASQRKGSDAGKDSGKFSLRKAHEQNSAGTSSEAVAVAVVSKQRATVVDSIESVKDSVSSNSVFSSSGSTHTVTNGNNSAAHKGGSGGSVVDAWGGGEGPAVNPESYSTDL